MNGLTADYNVEAGLGGNTDAIRNSIKRFLNDAFGTSLNVQLGPSNDLNITSSTLNNFNFSSSTIKMAFLNSLNLLEYGLRKIL